jgi:hypothetical protein
VILGDVEQRCIVCIGLAHSGGLPYNERHRSEVQDALSRCSCMKRSALRRVKREALVRNSFECSESLRTKRSTSATFSMRTSELRRLQRLGELAAIGMRRSAG